MITVLSRIWSRPAFILPCAARLAPRHCLSNAFWATAHIFRILADAASDRRLSTTVMKRSSFFTRPNRTTGLGIYQPGHILVQRPRSLVVVALDEVKFFGEPFNDHRRR
jgi:hypothetical protein